MSNLQGRDIREAIIKCIETGITDKQEIYSHIVKELGVPRPTVRRVAGALRNDLAAEIVDLEEKIRRNKKQLNGLK